MPVKNINIIGECIHGSCLYGTDGPNSDLDKKAIYLPSINNLILMCDSKTKSAKETLDNERLLEFEAFSLQRFLILAANGDDVAITMLHAPDDKILIDSPLYKYLRLARKSFYTKNMTGSLHFAKSMSLKYALRADRLLAVEKIIKIIKEGLSQGYARIYQFWEHLPEDGQYFIKGIEERSSEDDKRYFECVGKKVTAKVRLDYALEIYQNLYDKYGDRVKMATSMNALDYKSISHAFRVAYQLRSIYLNGDFSFPLAETEFIKDIKYNKVNYIKDALDQKLNDLIAEVTNLAAKSSFPEQIDQNWLDSLILTQYPCTQK